ncbi:MAG TPA: DUF4340 domain-containing protein, partial [Chryseolinea sp.]|nr:DUF4340 domain-containing protein [Chryseolinea sp.]
ALFNNFDVQSIDQVTLQSARDSVTLKFDGSRWKVNERYAADPAMIEVMFATILQAEPKRPVPSVRQDSIAALLRDAGTQVMLFASGTPLMTFSAGGNAAKTQAYYLRNDQKIPYVMVIPGYRVYVSGIFELTESGWRDKRIFAFNWRLNFQELEATFSSSKADNFRVILKDQMLTVQGLNAVDSTRLNQYLNDVSQLAADEYVAANGTLDSLSKTQPVMSVSVRDVGRSYSLQLFRYPDSQGRVAGLLNGKEWAMFSRQAVGSISRPRRFFEVKP